MSSLRPPDPGILQVARSEGRAGELIEAVASCLVGLPLTELTRMLDMICVGFGEVRLRPMPRDEASLTTPRKRELAERRDATPMPLLALHIQCPFRLDSPTGPFVGAQDVYRLADPPHEWIEGRSKGDFSGCLFDARANELPTDAAPMMVEAVHADAGGGLRIELSTGWSLVVAPSTAALHEHWRLFEPGGGEHLVVFEQSDVGEPLRTD